MRAVLALITALAALWGTGCDRLPGRPDPAERYRRPSEILDFATLYSRNCSACHGAQGKLGPAQPLADPVYLAYVGPARLRQIAAEGVAGTPMPAFAQAEGGLLTDAQLDALMHGSFERWGNASQVEGVSLPAYDQSASGAAGIAPGGAERGDQAFAAFCAHCHGADGSGGAKGGSIVDPDFLALVSDQMLRTSVVAGRPELGMPDWRQAGKRPMTQQEINDVVAWMMARRTRLPKPR
ncbi:MAG: c-type cytochrome [Myxococcota bacterium]